MPELQLPCPPLSSWLVPLLDEGRSGLVELSRPPRRARPLLETMPELISVPWMDPPGEPFDAVLVFSELGTAPGVSRELSRWLAPGARVIELVEVRRSWPAAMLGLERPWLRRAERAARRVIDWSMGGLCQVEQWASPEPADLVVTMGRFVDAPADEPAESDDPVEIKPG